MNSQASRTAWSVWFAAGVLILAASSVAGFVLWDKIQNDPQFPMLIPRHGATVDPLRPPVSLLCAIQCAEGHAVHHDV